MEIQLFYQSVLSEVEDQFLGNFLGMQQFTMIRCTSAEEH